MAEIIIKGKAEFDRKLRELDFSMQRKDLIEVAKVGAQIIVDDARSRAPRDSGDLAEGIGMRANSKASDIHEGTVDVGYNQKQFYGLFVEKGTKERFNKKGKSSGRVTATHFLELALELNRDRVAAAMKAKMEEIIRRVVA